MSHLPFFSYLFADEVLFRLPADNLQPGKPGAAEEPPPHSSDTPAHPVAGPLASPAGISSFTSLKTRVLILVNTYGKGIKPEERAFLEKVLKAVQYDLGKVDLLELDKIGSPDASGLLSGGVADYVMLFGIRPESVNLDIDLELYIPRNIKGTWFLLSNSLLRIEMEESKRRDLWQALKKMFLGGR